MKWRLDALAPPAPPLYASGGWGDLEGSGGGSPQSPEVNGVCGGAPARVHGLRREGLGAVPPSGFLLLGK